jgi:cytochrome d ubiquinol oxidase subunit II
MWSSFWDVVFSGSSLLLAVFYGTALGNVVRGVPLDRDGYFFVPLWTTFRTGPEPGIVDWYTVLVGITALLVLTLHGALWVNLKTSGALQQKARRLASSVYWAACAAVFAITVCSFVVQPQLERRFSDHALLWGFPLIAALGLIVLRLSLTADLQLWAFIGSGTFIAGLLCSAAFGLFPLLLPASGDTSLSLTAFNSAAPYYGLAAGLKWWIPGFILAVSYSILVYRHFRGKAPVPQPEPEHQLASAAGD